MKFKNQKSLQSLKTNKTSEQKVRRDDKTSQWCFKVKWFVRKTVTWFISYQIIILTKTLIKYFFYITFNWIACLYFGVQEPPE